MFYFFYDCTFNFLFDQEVIWKGVFKCIKIIFLEIFIISFLFYYIF